MLKPPTSCSYQQMRRKGRSATLVHYEPLEWTTMKRGVTCSACRDHSRCLARIEPVVDGLPCGPKHLADMETMYVVWGVDWLPQGAHQGDRRDGRSPLARARIEGAQLAARSERPSRWGGHQWRHLQYDRRRDQGVHQAIVEEAVLHRVGVGTEATLVERPRMSTWHFTNLQSLLASRTSGLALSWPPFMPIYRFMAWWSKDLDFHEERGRLSGVDFDGHDDFRLSHQVYEDLWSPISCCEYWRRTCTECRNKRRLGNRTLSWSVQQPSLKTAFFPQCTV